MTLITDLLTQLETCYDALPRLDGARAERLGPFELFVRDRPGWPFYARPRPEAFSVTVAEVDAVRDRQRELGVPEALEWIDELAPGIAPAVEASGLPVLRAPLMVLQPTLLPTPQSLTTAECLLLDPDAADFPESYARSCAVSTVGFANGGTQTGRAGAAERDAAVPDLDPAVVASAAQAIRSGRKAEAVAITADVGLAARGAFQAAAGAAEIVGVATLPEARRRGLGAAVSAVLAREALEHGQEIVFLSAASEAVARVYARIGFRRVGTACIAQH